MTFKINLYYILTLPFAWMFNGYVLHPHSPK